MNANEIYNELVDFLAEKGISSSDREEIMESVRDYAEVRVRDHAEGRKDENERT